MWRPHVGSETNCSNVTVHSVTYFLALILVSQASMRSLDFILSREHLFVLSASSLDFSLYANRPVKSIISFQDTSEKLKALTRYWSEWALSYTLHFNQSRRPSRVYSGHFKIFRKVVIWFGKDLTNWCDLYTSNTRTMLRAFTSLIGFWYTGTLAYLCRLDGIRHHMKLITKHSVCFCALQVQSSFWLVL